MELVQIMDIIGVTEQLKSKTFLMQEVFKQEMFYTESY